MLKVLLKYLLLKKKKKIRAIAVKFDEIGVVTTDSNLVRRNWKLIECRKRNWLKRSHQIGSKAKKNQIERTAMAVTSFKILIKISGEKENTFCLNLLMTQQDDYEEAL